MAGGALLEAFIDIKARTDTVRPALQSALNVDATAAGQKVGTQFAGGVKGKLDGLGANGGLFKGLATAGAVIGIGSLTGALKGMVAAAEDSRKVANLTASTIKATGGAANITADQVGELATAISNKTGADDEAIQSGANLLLTFKNVRNEAGAGNDVFNQTVKIAQDMATVMGGDASSQAIALGKALNDPIAGVSALARVGVTFTDQQKEQIRTMVEAGDTLGAQKVILQELGSEFGGAAEAAASPTQRLAVVVGNLQEQIGGALLPVVDDLATFAADYLVPALSASADFVSRNSDVIIPLVAGVVALYGAYKLITFAQTGWAAAVKFFDSRLGAAILKLGSFNLATDAQIAATSISTATIGGNTVATSVNAGAIQTNNLAAGEQLALFSAREVSTLANTGQLALFTEAEVVNTAATQANTAAQLENAAARGTAAGAGGAAAGAAVAPVGKSGIISKLAPYAAGIGVLGGVAVAAGAAGFAITKFIERNQIADDVMKNLKQTTDQLSQALTSNGGEWDKQTKSVLAAQIQQSGLSEKAAKAGITLAQLTDGVSGTKEQYDALVRTWREAGDPSDDTIFALTLMAGSAQEATAQSKELTGATADLSGATFDNTQQLEDAAAAIERQISLYDRAKQVIAENQAAVISQAGAANAFQQELRALSGSLQENGTSFDITTEKGGANEEALRRLIEAAKDTALANFAVTGSVSGLNADLNAARGQILGTAGDNGVLKGTIGELIDKYGLIPDQITTKITADAVAAFNTLTTLGRRITDLQGNVSVIGVTLSAADRTYSEVEAAGGTVAGRAIGGPVFAGSRYEVNERGTETFVPNVNGVILTAQATNALAAGGSNADVVAALDRQTAALAANERQVASAQAAAQRETIEAQTRSLGRAGVGGGRLAGI